MKILKFISILMLIPSLCFGASSRNFAGGTSTDNINHGSSFDDLFQSTMTISFWEKITGFDTTPRRVFNKGSDGGGPGNGYFLDTTSATGGACSGTARHNLIVRWSGTEATWCVNSAISTGVWHFVAVTYNGTATTNDPSIFYNSVSQTVAESVGPSGTITSDAAFSYQVGNRETTKNRSFNGSIAYNSVHSQILTHPLIAESMYKPCSVPNGNVLCSPLFGDSTELDLSGNANTGTVSGASAGTSGPPVMFGGGLPL